MIVIEVSDYGDRHWVRILKNMTKRCGYKTRIFGWYWGCGDIYQDKLDKGVFRYNMLLFVCHAYAIRCVCEPFSLGRNVDKTRLFVFILLVIDIRSHHAYTYWFKFDSSRPGRTPAMPTVVANCSPANCSKAARSPCWQLAQYIASRGHGWRASLALCLL